MDREISFLAGLCPLVGQGSEQQVRILVCGGGLGLRDRPNHDDGPNQTPIVNPAPGNRFYRLHKP